MAHFKMGSDPIFVDEGWYRAKLTKLEEYESQNPLYPAPQVVWHFQLTNSGGKIMEDSRGFELDFWVFTSQSIGKKSNARPIMEALLNEAITTGDDPDELAERAIGKSCYVKIMDYFDVDSEPRGSRPVKGTWSSKRPAGALGQQTAAAARPGPRAPQQAFGPPEPEDIEEIPF